jgi:hypothetical protein
VLNNKKVKISRHDSTLFSNISTNFALKFGKYVLKFLSKVKKFGKRVPKFFYKDKKESLRVKKKHGVERKIPKK